MEYHQQIYTPFLHMPDELFERVQSRFPAKDAVVKNISMYVANLSNSPVIAVRRSGDFSWIKKVLPWHTLTYAKRAQDHLQDAGYVDLQLGWRRAGKNRGCLTRLKRRDSLDSLLGVVGAPTLNAAQVPPITLERYPLDLNMIDYVHIPPTSKVTKEMLRDAYVWGEQLNKEYFGPMHVKLDCESLSPEDRSPAHILQNVALTRMFNHSGHARFYQREAASYMSLPKRLRSHILLNGARTVEPDFTAMHLNLSYALAGKQLDMSDGYMEVVQELLGQDNDDMRAAVKRTILIGLNASSTRAWKSCLHFKHQNIIRTLEQYGQNLNSVLAAFKQVHEPIAHLLHQNISGQIMAADSQVMDNIIRSAMRANIPILPLHDGVRVATHQSNRVQELMSQAYTKVTGFDIAISTD